MRVPTAEQAKNAVFKRFPGTGRIRIPVGDRSLVVVDAKGYTHAVEIVLEPDDWERRPAQFAERHSAAVHALCEYRWVAAPPGVADKTHMRVLPGWGHYELRFAGQDALPKAHIALPAESHAVARAKPLPFDFVVMLLRRHASYLHAKARVERHAIYERVRAQNAIDTTEGSAHDVGRLLGLKQGRDEAAHIVNGAVQEQHRLKALLDKVKADRDTVVAIARMNPENLARTARTYRELADQIERFAQG